MWSFFALAPGGAEGSFHSRHQPRGRPPIRGHRCWPQRGGPGCSCGAWRKHGLREPRHPPRLPLCGPTHSSQPGHLPGSERCLPGMNRACLHSSGFINKYGCTQGTSSVAGARKLCLTKEDAIANANKPGIISGPYRPGLLRRALASLCQ